MGGASDLRKSFGEMILPKGTILYHTSQNPFTQKLDKPMFFLTFHPSEYIRNYNEYVTRVILNKDVSLFFMIGFIRGLRIFPLLQRLVNNPDKNLAKQKNSNLNCFVKYLKEDSFDGWFSTIEGKTNVEVALINDSTLYSIIDSNKPTWDWENSYYNNNDDTIIPKKWGTTYPISTQNIKLKINLKYKLMIEKYLENDEDPNGNTFQIILQNAAIEYIEGSQIFPEWKC